MVYSCWLVASEKTALGHLACCLRLHTHSGCYSISCEALSQAFQEPRSHPHWLCASLPRELSLSPHRPTHQHSPSHACTLLLFPCLYPCKPQCWPTWRTPGGTLTSGASSPSFHHDWDLMVQVEISEEVLVSFEWIQGEKQQPE